MKSTTQYSVGGELYDVADDRLDEFLADTIDYEDDDIERVYTFNVNGQQIQVKESRLDEFYADCERDGVTPRETRGFAMDDGSVLHLGDEDVRQFVQARRTGQTMSRGLLRNTGIPEIYGRSAADRDKLADAFAQFYPDEKVEPVSTLDGPNLGDEIVKPFNYLRTQTEARFGRDVSGLEALGENTPFVGSVMDANEARKEEVMKRLYNGDYRDSLEASRLALSIGVPQDTVRQLNAAANGDDASMRKGFSDLVKDDLASRIVTRQKKGQQLDSTDLDLIQKGIVGGTGLVKTVAEMSSPATAAATYGMSTMNRAAELNRGEWDVDKDGNPVQTMTGDGGDLSMLKGAAGAAAERAIWMNKLPGAKSAMTKLGKTALGRNAVQLGEMVVKSDFSDLVDYVVGLGVPESEAKKSVSEWAEQHLTPQGIAADVLEAAPAHFALKFGKMITPKGREAARAETAAIKDEIARREAEDARVRAEKERNAADLREAKREVAREAYDQSLSEEGAYQLDRDIQEQIDAGTIPESAREVVRRKMLGKVENARSLEDPRVREAALLSAMAEVTTPTRVSDTPAVERRRVEQKMRENEYWAKRSDELVKEYGEAEAARRLAEEQAAAERQNAAQNAEADRIAAKEDEVRSAFAQADEPTAEPPVTPAQPVTGSDAASPTPAERVPDGKGRMKRSAKKKQAAAAPTQSTDAVADTPPAEATLDNAPSEPPVKAPDGKGKMVDKPTESPLAVRDAMKDDPVLKRIDAEYGKAKTSAERNALAEQFKARIAELQGAKGSVEVDRKGKESAKTDAEPQKPTVEVSETDGEEVKTDTASPSPSAPKPDGKGRMVKAETPTVAPNAPQTPPVAPAPKNAEPTAPTAAKLTQRVRISGTNRIDALIGKSMTAEEAETIVRALKDGGVAYPEVRNRGGKISVSFFSSDDTAKVRDVLKKINPLTKAEEKSASKKAEEERIKAENDKAKADYLSAHAKESDFVNKMGLYNDTQRVEVVKALTDDGNVSLGGPWPIVRRYLEGVGVDTSNVKTLEDAKGVLKKAFEQSAAPTAEPVQPLGGNAEAKNAPSAKTPLKPVDSAKKLLKEEFFQDAESLQKQLRSLPRNAPAQLRTAYETAIAEARKRASEPNDPTSDISQGGKFHGSRQQISDATPAQKLADPDFRAWAAKQGRTATDGARRDYDAQQVDALGKHVAKNWIRGVTFRRSENAAEVPTNARQLYSRDGNVVGWYDSAKKEVVTLPGADAGTVAHELGWHATYEHAKERAAAGDRTLLDKLNQYANDARRIVVDPTTGRTLEQEITARYGRNGVTDPAVLLDEIGAARYTMEQIGKIKDAAARRQAAKWYERTWNAVTDTYKSALSKLGWNKARLEGISALSPAQTVELLADEMLKGRTLGKAKNVRAIDMSKRESLVEKHDRKLKDYLRPVEELEKDAGKSVTGSAHTMLRLVPGKVQAAIREAETFGSRIEAECKKSGIKIAELNEYMYAKAADERNAKVLRNNGRIDGSAMSHADAQRIIDAYRNSPKYSELERIRQDVLRFQRRGFDQRVNSGLISRKVAADLIADEPNHVPMKSRFDADGNHTGFDGNATFGKPEWRKAEGRTNLGDGPLEWILQEYVDAKSHAAKNNARQALLTTVLAHPEVGTVRKLREGDALGEITRKGMKGDPNVIVVKSNGDTYQIRFNGPRGEAIARAVTGRGLFRTWEPVQKVMRWWSSTATEWSPTFAVRNFLADTLDVFAVNATEHGVVGGAVRNARHVYNAMKLIPAVGKYVKTGEISNPLVREAVDAGILMGGGVRGQAFDSGENVLQTLRTDMKKGKSKVRAIGKTLFGWVNTLNQTAELMNRMADYKLQRQAGKSMNEAALHAREITVDFNEKGEITPLTNLGYMFSNSALGATMRLNKALFTGKHGAQLAIGTFGLGLAEGMIDVFMNGDDEEGKNFSEYTRANSIYVRKGKDIVRTPYHTSILSIIKYGGNCAARYIMDKVNGTDSFNGDKAAKQIGKDCFSMMTQMLGLGDVGDNVVAGVWPTILQPFVQAIGNRDYADRPIENEQFDEYKPKSHNGRQSTPQPYKDAAEFANDTVGGGNEARKGSFMGVNTDVSPEMLKHMTEAVGKNALRDVVNTVDTTVQLIRMITGNAEWDRRNIPIVRDYYRETGGNDSRYFEELKKFKADVGELNDRGDWTAEELEDYIAKHPGVMSKDGVSKIVKAIDTLRKLEQGKVKSGRGWKSRGEEVSKEQIQEWRKQREELQGEVIRLLTSR